MKRFLSSVGMRWAHAFAKHKILCLFAVIFLSLLIFVPVKYAKADNGALPTDLTWVNHEYLSSSNGQNLKDSNSFDTNYEYVQLDGGTCPNKVNFNGSKGEYGTTQANAMFFYQTSNDYYNSFTYTISYNGSAKQNGECGYSTLTFSTKESLYNANYRRYTWYRDGTKIYNIFSSGQSFTQTTDFLTVNRFYRDSESGSAACSDVILLHKAQTGTDKGKAIFGSSEIPESSIFYSVTKNTGSGVLSESYKVVTESSDIDYDNCVVDKDQVRKAKSGVFPQIYGDSDADWEYISSSGLDDAGETNLKKTYEDFGQISEDAFVVFVGYKDANMPKDSSGSTITEDSSTTETAENTCSGGVLGWIICAILDYIQSFLDTIREKLMGLLTVAPLSLDTTSSMFIIWDRIRNLANIAFIVVFFVIIFSQATSIGISNYGIKRLLPRLVIIAVAANLSYYVCVFMVDLFNILGSGMYNLLANAGGATTISISNSSAASFGGLLALSATAVVFTSAAGQLFILVVVAFLSILLAYIALLLRQMVIIILVVISPIAFIAGLLPGTQDWLKKWADMFMSLLALYPIVMFIFAAAELVSTILNSAGAIIPGGLFGL